MEQLELFPLPAVKRVSDTYFAFVHNFSRFANALAARTGGKVYLTGSTLWKKNPRDIDIRVVIPELDFARLFGEDPKEQPCVSYPGVRCTVGWNSREWAVGYENLKQSRVLSKKLGFSIDIQFITEVEAVKVWKMDETNSLRLDQATDEFLAAGLHNL